MAFLPVSRQELIQKGIETPDFVFVTGDAYVDHPSFGVSILSRLLEHHGYTVAILPQPDINGTKDLTRFGRPKLGFW